MIKGLPMRRGFTNNFRIPFAIVDLDTVNKFDEPVTPQVLAAKGHIRDLTLPLKVVGDGQLTKPVTVTAHRFTKSAREKIEAAGGKTEETK